MCAILDANVVHEVFGSSRPTAGKGFFDWIDVGRGHLVVGGKLHKELTRHSRFYKWAQRARQSGRLRLANDGKVDARTEELRRDEACKSDDPHIIALAQVERVRLLYSNDRDLQRDFRNKALIDNPRGSVYTTRVNKEFTPDHKKLLQRVYCSLP